MMEQCFFEGYLDEIRISNMARYTGQGLIDSDFTNPSTEFGIETEGSTYGRFDTQVTANTTYKRYNYLIMMDGNLHFSMELIHI